MNNLYWPIYKNLESEFNRLMFEIHIDDIQLNVYSPKIGELITRSVMEIESITKDLYSINGGADKSFFKYDDVGLKYLEKVYELSNKVINITSTNCFISNRVLKPFKKTEVRTAGTKLTYSWNNAYQNIKHDRAKNLSFASIKYLFDAMAALYLLNIYYKDEEYDVGKDTAGLTFPYNQGSDIYSVKLYTDSAGLRADKSFHKSADFPEYVFRIEVHDNPTTDAAIEAMKESDAKRMGLFINHLQNLADSGEKVLMGSTQEDVTKFMQEEHQRMFGELLVKSMGDPLLYSQKLMALTYKAIIVKEPSPAAPNNSENHTPLPLPESTSV